MFPSGGSAHVIRELPFLAEVLCRVRQHTYPLCCQSTRICLGGHDTESEIRYSVGLSDTLGIGRQAARDHGI